MKGFRKKYKQENGHEKYYEKIKNSQLIYSNPHYNKFPYIIEKIINWLPDEINLNKLQNSSNPVIDLAAGTGQITKLLLEYNINNIIGIEPYLYEEYYKKTQKQVFSNTFNDIINNIISFEKIPIIFCSYGLHLCDNVEELLEKLKNWTKYLCVITPNGLPNINSNDWTLHYKFKYSGIKIFMYERR